MYAVYSIHSGVSSCFVVFAVELLLLSGLVLCVCRFRRGSVRTCALCIPWDSESWIQVEEVSPCVWVRPAALVDRAALRLNEKRHDTRNRASRRVRFAAFALNRFVCALAKRSTLPAPCAVHRQNSTHRHATYSSTVQQ